MNHEDIQGGTEETRSMRGAQARSFPFPRRQMLRGAAAASIAAILAACRGGNSPIGTPRPTSVSTTNPANIPVAPTGTHPAASALTSTRPAGSALAILAPTMTTGSVVADPVASATVVRAKETVRVGIVTSRSGPFASYGQQYLEGFRIGLDYATNGTGAVVGHAIQYDVRDDAGDPATGVAAARDFIGQGYRIIGGSVVSGVALQIAPLAGQQQVLYLSGPATTDLLTGINTHTFRSGRQSVQDILAVKALLAAPPGKTVLVFAQETAFGRANVAAVTQVFTPDGATVDQLLVPQDAGDFTPFARAIAGKHPDLLFVAWAGTSATTMYGVLDSEGVLGSTNVVTGLGDRSTYTIFGPAAEKIAFISSYIYQAPQNDANRYLVGALHTKNQLPDLFNPDGFAAAQMIVHAVEVADGNDVNTMIAALEGFTFTGLKGDYAIRSADHALLQPMFHVKLVSRGDRYETQPVATIPPSAVAPPLKG